MENVFTTDMAKFLEGAEESMDSEVQPPGDDHRVEMELEASGLRDEVEVLARRMRGTRGAGLAISVLFVAAGAFMQQSSTLWFLGVLWLFFTLRHFGSTLKCFSNSARRKGAPEDPH